MTMTMTTTQWDSCHHLTTSTTVMWWHGHPHPNGDDATTTIPTWWHGHPYPISDDAMRVSMQWHGHHHPIGGDATTCTSDSTIEVQEYIYGRDLEEVWVRNYCAKAMYIGMTDRGGTQLEQAVRTGTGNAD
ncbi:hypothetical protein EV363DRAFT_1292136 [Boletus edulis]|nr:hypothetical protein EV363DRAFT_1292136 [Boletus edulis]